VALHAGSLAALVIGCRGEALTVLQRLSLRRVGMHLAAGGIPAVIGFALERRPIHRPVIPGLVFGAALLVSAARTEGGRSRWDAGLVDGCWLGVAQAAALWPGVSRNGSSLAVARLRGFAAAEANPLSREVGVPVTLGAVALRRGGVNLGTVTSFASALATFPAMRWVDRGAPLWPFAAERLGLALLLLRESRS
jgi:undecaprenyl-diphosphatase